MLIHCSHSRQFERVILEPNDRMHAILQRVLDNSRQNKGRGRSNLALGPCIRDITVRGTSSMGCCDGKPLKNCKAPHASKKTLRAVFRNIGSILLHLERLHWAPCRHLPPSLYTAFATTTAKHGEIVAQRFRWPADISSTGLPPSSL